MKRLSVALVVIIGAVAFGACSGDDTVASRLTVVGTEMAFDAPAHVPAGKYVVTFRNAGTIYHELAFKDPTGQVVARSMIAGGQEQTVNVVLKSGTWELGCFEPGHYEGGMHRPLVVDPS